MNSTITESLRVERRPETIINSERCVGCQECVVRCPTKALSMDVRAWTAVVDNTLCVGCRQCERTCPFSAIRVEGGVAVSPHTEIGSVSLSRPVQIGNVDEVRPGFSGADAIREAARCLNCPDPTCVRGCPAHNDIPGFIEAIRDRDLERAQNIISHTSCLPEVCSRVCNWSAQCEGACTWALAGAQPVAIGKLERFVTDESAYSVPARRSERGKGLDVAIIGSGPAGLGAATELAAAGAKVTMYEREATLGGVPQWGIPSYILPDTISQRSVRSLIDMGVQVNTNTSVTAESLSGLLEKHDAIIVACGALEPEKPAIPGLDLEGVVDSTTFLTSAKRALSEGTTLAKVHGARVLVLGGSNTALDVARTTVRLGGKPIVIHRRLERFSRARADEIAEAKGEGVEFKFATNILRLEGDNGILKRAVLVHTGQSGSKPGAATSGTGDISIDADMVVLATGYGLDPAYSGFFGHLPVRQPMSDSLFPDRRWVASGVMPDRGVGGLAWQREYSLRAAVSEKRDRIWVVGDALSGPSTVVGAMAQGRIAAVSVLEKRPGRSKV